MMVVLRMDMLMTMWIVISLYTFYRMYEDREHRYGQPRQRVWRRWLFPLWIFLGIFTKGPMGILIPLVSTLVFLWERSRLRYIGLAWGWRTWLVLLLLCGLWFGGVYLEGGRDYLDNLLFHQTVDRAVNAFHHKRPFYYYFVSMWYTFQPWAFLIFGAAVAAMTKRGRWRSDIERFFLLSGISTLALLSFISSKIQVYMLPSYPFLVYFAAIYASRYRESRLVIASVTLPAVVLCVAGVSVWFVSRIEGMEMLRQPLIYIAGGLLGLCSGLGIWFMWRGRNVGYGIRWISLGLFMTIFVAGFAVPLYNRNLGYGEMCGEAAQMMGKYDAEGFYVYKVRRPENMDVYLGRRPLEIDPEAETPADSLPEGKWIVMTPVENTGIFPMKSRKVCGEYSVMVVAGKESRGKQQHIKHKAI